MTDKADIYKSRLHCGTICEILHPGTAHLICCGTKMMLMSPELLEGPREQHVPVIDKKEGGYAVIIGDDPHPMTEDHYIEWIELVIGNKACKQFLKPGDKSETFSLLVANLQWK